MYRAVLYCSVLQRTVLYCTVFANTMHKVCPNIEDKKIFNIA